MYLWCLIQMGLLLRFNEWLYPILSYTNGNKEQMLLGLLLRFSLVDGSKNIVLPVSILKVSLPYSEGKVVVNWQIDEWIRTRSGNLY